MRLFVTGTDTGVGKTVITACLAAAGRARGTVVACKPVASGVTPGTAGEDAEGIALAAGHPPLVLAAFAAPLSPHRAAALEGRAVPDDLLDRIRALDADLVLVEGVGGWKVPLRRDPPLWVEDLARATGGPVVVVAADKLGVLNHTLLTVDAIRAAGLEVGAVVLNRGAAPPDGSRTTNADDLADLLTVPVIPAPSLDPGDRETAVSLGAAVLRAIVEAGGRAVR